MNRNTEAHFSELPNIDIERSRFDLSHSHKTSFNAGELIPILVQEVLPGDTFDLTTSAVVRLQTPLTPIMDNIYLDTYFFFVPLRLAWSHAKEFFGENTESAWIPSTEYIIPTIKTPENGFDVGTIADHMGIPTGVNADNLIKGISAIPFRDYAIIANEYFRDQNLTDPLVINLGDETQEGVNTGNYITDVANGGLPFKVAKYHDMFTSCLPSPQKGPSIGVWSNELGTQDPFVSWIPVMARTDQYSNDGSSPIQMKVPGQTLVNPVRYEAPNNGNLVWAGTDNPDLLVSPVNLWANVGAMELSVNQLRLAFQLQKFYERQARSGSRYREVLKAHFGITTSDARMQIPEYLGGHRFPLSIHQVANQSQSTGENDFLGDLGAMSNTTDVHEDFIKSFEEHGYIIGVCCVRYDHSYPQGLEKFWTRSTKTDFYWPVFANIGEQPLYKSQLMLTDQQNGTEVFGYNEAWCEYRTRPNFVTGEMRPNAPLSLATWHLADDYDQVPSLSDEWIREDKSNIDRVLSITSSVSNQIFADFYFNLFATRPLPTYSVPGLIDHH